MAICDMATSAIWPSVRYGQQCDMASSAIWPAVRYGHLCDMATVQVWNFSSGALIKSLDCPLCVSEITCVLHVQEGGRKHIIAAGWDRLVFAWPDTSHDTIESEKVPHPRSWACTLACAHGCAR